MLTEVFPASLVVLISTEYLYNQHVLHCLEIDIVQKDGGSEESKVKQ